MEKSSIFVPPSVEVAEACQVLEDLKCNRTLKSITLQPTSCYMEWYNFNETGCHPKWLKEENFITVRDFCTALVVVVRSASALEHLSWGLTDGWDGWQNFILESLRRCQPKSLHSLHMATLRSDPLNNCMPFVDRSLLSAFNLTCLTLDYVHLSEEMLMELSRHCEHLTELTLFLHQWQPDTPYIRNQIWRHVARTFPRLQVTLNLVHADSSMDHLVPHIFQPGLPLAHLRLYFCGSPDPNHLRFLGNNYGETLRGIHLVEALLDDGQPNHYKCPEDLSPDPFVMLAWRCKLLEDFVLCGFCMNVTDLKALSALRGGALKRLEIPECCIFFDECKEFDLREDYEEEISGNLGRSWRPLSETDLDSSLVGLDWNTEGVYLPLFLAEQEPHKRA